RLKGMATALLGYWSIDARMNARSALPLNITAGTDINPIDGTIIAIPVSLNLGVPVYIENSGAPGGRQVNKAAFSIPAPGQRGPLGRNAIRGLPAWQVDFALRRQFNLSERVNIQFRAEAFNLFNHPNFGAVQNDLTSPNFREAINMLGRQLGGLDRLYQIGGPPLIQLALRLSF